MTDGARWGIVRGLGLIAADPTTARTGPRSPAAPSPAPTPAERPEPLWREVIGRRLRALRRAQGRTLAEIAARAGISTQYLSEIERGRKDPSSEIVAAVAGALGCSVAALAALAADDLADLATRAGAAIDHRARPTTRIRPIPMRLNRIDPVHRGDRGQAGRLTGPVALAA